MLKYKVKAHWMVLARHFGMEGGILDYGLADIKEFFDDYDRACVYAEELLKNTEEGLIEPMIWVLKCERTYQRSKQGLCYVYS